MDKHSEIEHETSRNDLQCKRWGRIPYYTVSFDVSSLFSWYVTVLAGVSARLIENCDQDFASCRCANGHSIVWVSCSAAGRVIQYLAVSFVVWLLFCRKIMARKIAMEQKHRWNSLTVTSSAFIGNRMWKVCLDFHTIDQHSAGLPTML